MGGKEGKRKGWYRGRGGGGEGQDVGGGECPEKGEKEEVSVGNIFLIKPEENIIYNFSFFFFSLHQSSSSLLIHTIGITVSNNIISITDNITSNTEKNVAQCSSVVATEVVILYDQCYYLHPL